jgi:hypothetical protein
VAELVFDSYVNAQERAAIFPPQYAPPPPQGYAPQYAAPPPQYYQQPQQQYYQQPQYQQPFGQYQAPYGGQPYPAPPTMARASSGASSVTPTQEEGATATYTDKELEQAIIDNGRLDLQDATAEEGDTEEGDPSTAFQQTQSSEATPDNPYQ